MGIKQRIGLYYYNAEVRKKKHRDRRFTPLENAKLIGVVFDADNDVEQKTALQLAEILRGQKKEVLLMGYFNAKKFPPNLHIAYGNEYFNRTHLNWAGLPVHINLKSYLNTTFDYLINISTNNSVIFPYLMVKSSAKCTVGRYSQTFADAYDLMLETKENDFIAQLLHYLQKIG